ncbi:MAG TPA: hypothetical protein VHR15_08560 [Ktedonobacterales bacterium]|jgi:hypothetical protein|nr:hypothetical protein [Ktedonobacterales bacterium]
MPPDDESIDKATFRRQLDATLRQRDSEALRQFLLESGQWQENSVPTDVPAAMWMMILASPALSDLHAEAQTWLRSNGHAQEAELLAGRKKSSGMDTRSGGGRPHQKGRNHRNNKRP